MNKKIKASFTVEAAFAISIVLFTIVFIIYLSFYLHDHNKMIAITDAVLHKVTLNLKHEADIGSGRVNYDEINKGILSQIFDPSTIKEREIENYLRGQLSDSFLVTKVEDIQVSVGRFKISIRVKGNFLVPLRGIQNIFTGEHTLTVETEAAYHYPADSVRISEVILDTGSKIKGFDKLKEVVEKLIPE